MKTTLISISINILLAVLLVIAINQCDDNHDKLIQKQDEYNLLKARADSLSNRAAIDCDQKIEQALNRTYEKDPDRPAKPALLR